MKHNLATTLLSVLLPFCLSAEYVNEWTIGGSTWKLAAPSDWTGGIFDPLSETWTKPPYPPTAILTGVTTTKDLAQNLIIPSAVLWSTQGESIYDPHGKPPLTAIRYSAFRNWNDLKSVTIPGTVTTIGLPCFRGCGGLTNITYNSAPGVHEVSYSSPGGILYNGDGSVLLKYPEGREEAFLALSANVTNLCDGSLAGTRLRGVLFEGDCPNATVSAFADSSFIVYRYADTVGWPDGKNATWCGRKIHVLPRSMEERSATTNNYGNVSWHNYGYEIVDGVLFKYEKVRVWIPDPPYSAYGKATLVSVPDIAGALKIPASLGGLPVTEIGDGAVMSHYGIVSVELPSSVEKIGASAFAYCYSLEEINILDSVKSVGAGAFAYDSKLLDSASHPGLVMVDGWVVGYGEDFHDATLDLHAFRGVAGRAFESCAVLEKIIMAPQISILCYEAFRNCTNLTQVSFCEGLEEIEEGAFRGSGLVAANLPDGLKKLGFYVFYHAPLEYLRMPVSLENKGSSFYCDSYLKTIDIATRIIESGFFQRCSNLENVILRESVEEIEDFAFGDNCNLKTLVVPPSVTKFDGTYASFENPLTLVLPSTIRSWVKANTVLTTCSAYKTSFYDPADFHYVRFDTNGGWMDAPDFITVGGKLWQYPEPRLEKHSFLGWFTAKDGGVKISASSKISQDMVLYAHWLYDGSAMVNVECTYAFTGGNKLCKAGEKVTLKIMSPSVHVTHIDLDGNKTYTDEVFAGWYMDGVPIVSDVDYRNPSITYVAQGESDVTIYGRYELSEEDIASFSITVEDMTTDSDGAILFDLASRVSSLSLPSISVKGLPTGMKFDAKTGIVSGTATKPGVYKVSVSATNATVKKPVTAEFEIVVPNLASEKLPGLEQDKDAYGTVMCGVALPMNLVDCSPDDGWAVKVSGLPAGLKFTAKDIMKKGSKTEVEIPANTIYGVPTAKPGAYTVTFTATKGKENQTATITLNVEPLPTWAVGTFTGYVVGDDWSRGFATMTVAANGKVSGKIALEGTNWTFSATSFSRVEYVERVEGGVATNFVVEAVAKAGKVERTIELVAAACDGGFVEAALPNAVAEGTFGDGEVKMWRGMWKDKETAAEAKATIEKFMGVYTVSVAAGADYGSGYMSLTVGKDGNVKASGKLADGTSVSANSPLMYDEDAGWFVMLYAAPSAYKGGAFAAAVGFDDRLAPVLFIPQWTSRNPQATGEYGEGVVRDVDLVGAYYDKLDTLRKYYESVRLELDGAPELGFTYKETSLNEYGKKVTTSSAVTAQAADTLGQPGLTVTVNEKGAIVVAKATKPVQDKSTKEWSYDGVNDGALTLSFTQATGIFKGSYTFWYDYMSAYDETTGKGTLAHTSKKVNFEGILVQGDEPKMEGFYLWDATGEYEDEKTGKLKSYKYKQSFPVRLLAQ